MLRHLIATALVLMLMICGTSCAIFKSPINAPMQTVESSMIKSVGYDSAAQVLVIQFVTTGDTFVYRGVPEKVYDELMAADSKGRYYSKNIKGKYQSSRK